MKTIALIAALIATPIAAQEQEMQCGPTEQVYADLSQKFGEGRVFWAQHAVDQIIEMWAGPSGWTIFVTFPDGTSCLIADGVDWGMMPSEVVPNL